MIVSVNNIESLQQLFSYLGWTYVSDSFSGGESLKKKTGELIAASNINQEQQRSLQLQINRLSAERDEILFFLEGLKEKLGFQPFGGANVKTPVRDIHGDIQTSEHELEATAKLMKEIQQDLDELTEQMNQLEKQYENLMQAVQASEDELQEAAENYEQTEGKLVRKIQKLSGVDVAPIMQQIHGAPLANVDPNAVAAPVPASVSPAPQPRPQPASKWVAPVPAPVSPALQPHPQPASKWAAPQPKPAPGTPDWLLEMLMNNNASQEMTPEQAARLQKIAAQYVLYLMAAQAFMRCAQSYENNVQQGQQTATTIHAQMQACRANMDMLQDKQHELAGRLPGKMPATKF